MKIIELHRQNPNPRHLAPVLDALNGQQSILINDDGYYTLIKKVYFNNAYLICTDISSASQWVQIDNDTHRALKKDGSADNLPTQKALKATKQINLQLNDAPFYHAIAPIFAIASTDNAHADILVTLI